MPANSMTCGDFQALQGANVDLSGPGNGGGPFCELAGTFTTLASVPTSYSGCNWTNYVEGIVGLADHGYIMRDAALAHHYRVRVVSNTGTALVFSYAAID